MGQGNSLYYLVYTSTATTPFDEEALSELLRTSCTANGRRGVTGALHYRNGIFVQMLEGSEEEVEELRGKIYRDPRHSGIMTLTSGFARRRVFPEWTMHFISADERGAEENERAYRRLSGKGDLEEMVETSPGYHPGDASGELHPGLRLLLIFRQIM